MLYLSQEHDKAAEPQQRERQQLAAGLADSQRALQAAHQQHQVRLIGSLATNGKNDHQ